MNPYALPVHLSAGDGEVLSMRVAGSPEDPPRKLDRDSLLADLRAGKPMRLELDAIVYIQRDEPNRNYVRFKDSALRRFAASFVGQPVMRDHEQGNSLARAGTIRSSELIEYKPTSRVEGVPAIRQTLELVRPWAVEGALDGTLDRFSIGWHSKADPLCTACKNPIISRQCEHFPGESFTDEKTGETRKVEMLYTEMDGIETSAVSVPAVPGTGIEEVRATLSAARAALKKESPMTETTEAAAPQLTLEAAIAELEQTRAVLAKEREEHKLTLATLDEHLAKAKKIEGEQAARDLETLISAAKDQGKILIVRDRQGAEIQGGVEKFVRETAAGPHGLPGARVYVDQLPVIVPVAARASSVQNAPTREQTFVHISESRMKMFKQFGVTPEMYAKFGPKEQPAEQADAED